MSTLQDSHSLLVRMATFFQKKGVKFPRTAFLLSVALAIVLCWFGGLSVWSSLLVAVGQFLFMGGLQYCILAYHTLPRDLRYAGRRETAFVQSSILLRFDYR